MLKEDKRLLKDLSSIAGNDAVSCDVYERISYGQDSVSPDLDIDKIPSAVVKPSTVEQVSAVIKYANKKKIPIYVHGAGTAFKGSAKPKRPGSILLSTQSLLDFELKEEDQYFEVGAGVNQYELEKLLAKQNYFLPLNVGSKYSSTIGGAVAINTVGHMIDACMGKIIDHVMGVEVVLPNGEILETGTKSIRRPAGIDYTRFFAGMEGAFGVITRIRMRLIPEFKKSYIVGFFPDLTDIGRAFMRCYSEKMPPPLYGEMLDKNACEGPFRIRNLGDPPGDMALAIAIGHTQQDADQQGENILRAFKSENSIKAWIVKSKKEQEDFWDARDNILNMFQGGEGKERLLKAGSVEATAPLSHLVDLIEYMRSGHSYDMLKECKLYMYGHVGTCDLHGMWVNHAGWPAEKRMAALRQGQLLESEINLKWDCASGEVGQTGSRIPFLKKRYGESAHSMLMDVKRAIDPNNILNPGNIEGEGYE